MYYMNTHCTYTEDYADGVHTYTFSGPCVETGKTYTVKVKGTELYQCNGRGEGIMALVSTNADDREFLMSGHSPEGWNLLFQKGGDA